MPEWFSIDLPDWVFVAALASNSLFLLLVLLSLVMLISVVRQTQTLIGQSIENIHNQVKSLAISLEETGPVRYALAGLVAMKKEMPLTSKELQEEIESLLKDYKDIDDIVEELKLSLLTLDDQASRQNRTDKRGQAQ